MDLSFYSCDNCSRVMEWRILQKQEKCTCNGRRVKPVVLTVLELFWFLVRNPSYIVLALRGEK